MKQKNSTTKNGGARDQTGSIKIPTDLKSLFSRQCTVEKDEPGVINKPTLLKTPQNNENIKIFVQNLGSKVTF
jgi:hypothetical protein